MSVISLGFWDLAAASLLLLLNGILSLWLSLGIERQLLVAAVRMVVQLIAVGAVLTLLFGTASLAWTCAIGLAMVLLAGREIMARQVHRLAGWWGYGLGTATMAFACASLTLFALLGSIRPDPWFAPQYAIPLFGMILGNAMTGISLGLDALTTAVTVERPAIEARIALGALRFEALQPILRQAMRRGLMPTINAMAAMGIVSLPGMMTGQILAGVPPEQAVRYQLLIMFLISGSTGLGLFMALVGVAWRLTDHRHRLRPDRLKTR
ncbi:iron export ABC transporter permease subunit FetB [Methylobacterium sp.]|uniref:ABC transporter permease n=1 Tax=Methylobacterium sp. TaxID=409 RepID=UPI000C53D705|nr:iron export ABC transporter permease subunit FetB [Methylobacterium sp.]MBP29027.1 iron export ABC transporter permease subunit FetB [Methylobacterium sp.]